MIVLLGASSSISQDRGSLFVRKGEEDRPSMEETCRSDLEMVLDVPGHSTTWSGAGPSI